jgi:folate-binding protein YgfZ
MFSLDGYQALRRGAGAARRTDRGVLSVRGADRLTWLQGLLTNDVLALPIGGVCDAAYLTPQGRMIADMRVVNGPDAVFLDVPASLAATLRAKLDGLLFAEDASIVDDSARLAMIDAHGPLVTTLTGDALSTLAAGAEAVVFDQVLGVPGVSIFALREEAESIVSRLGASGIPEVTLDTLNVLRVEAGRPAFLVDMDEHTIPLEAGLEERAISFTKGCYVGQEVIVRVMHRGQGRVAKKLVGLLLSGEDPPPAGSPISSSDREVGRVTSAVWSPALSRPIALGYVHRDFLEAGTALTVASFAGPIMATVTTLPFVPAVAADPLRQP